MVAQIAPARIDDADRRVVACNYAEATATCSEGALVYVSYLAGMAERAWIVARSRSGRWIQKWEDVRRLRHCRLKTIPPQHPRYGDERTISGDPDGLVTRMQDVTEGGKWFRPR